MLIKEVLSETANCGISLFVKLFIETNRKFLRGGVGCEDHSRVRLWFEIAC